MTSSFHRGVNETCTLIHF